MENRSYRLSTISTAQQCHDMCMTGAYDNWLDDETGGDECNCCFIWLADEMCYDQQVTLNHLRLSESRSINHLMKLISFAGLPLCQMMLLKSFTCFDIIVYSFGLSCFQQLKIMQDVMQSVENASASQLAQLLMQNKSVEMWIDSLTITLWFDDITVTIWS